MSTVKLAADHIRKKHNKLTDPKAAGSKGGKKSAEIRREKAKGNMARMIQAAESLKKESKRPTAKAIADRTKIKASTVEKALPKVRELAK